MGYSVQSSEETARRKKQALAAKAILADHPNYREPNPLAGESLIGFVLRSTAHLVSPPMDDDETYECECVDVATEIRAMEDTLTKIWGGR